LVHAPEVIGLDDEPRSAVRYKRKASLLVTLRQVTSGRCVAAVSAGNPGAAIAASLRELGVVPQARRAALASVYPRAVEHAGQDPLALALDVGATVISKVAEPRVALLNMGRDAAQGDEVLVAAHRRLRDLRTINFVGNIEGHELTSGRADVVVCEGLLGNIVLKLLESVANVAVDLTSAAAPRNWRLRAGMAIMARGSEQLRAQADYATYGGAPLLGFEQVFIKAHARSQAAAISNAVKVAAKAARDGLVPALKAALAELP
jgi:glycerol-3-phosphate acyltransferase PlsX